MKFIYSIKTAISGLTAHKSRSALTILGIVIGITSIIIIMSVGKGAQELILSQLRGLGSQTISIEPGREPKGPADFAEMFSDSIGTEELKALSNKSNVSGIAALAPTVMVPGTLSYQGETFRANILGVSPNITKMLDVKPAEGAFFDENDVKQRATVVILGSEIREELFGTSDALGQKVKMKNKTFRVIGVIAPKGQVAMLNVDEMAVIPYTTAQHYLLGISHFHAILAQAESEEIIPRVVEEIKLTLRELHGITDPDKDDFHVMSQAEIAEQVKTITGILTALLGAVAAISLVVGGIGIMNIMLVSVTERTHEIGLRKALGATEGNILTQFLLEAVMLTCTGGIIGILLGAGFSFTASLALSKFVASGWAFTLSLQAIILGLAVSGCVGLLFGLYPARTASKKSPIEALRYE